MTIDDERPEDELHELRISEMLGVMALIYEVTQNRPGSGVIACPVCRTGELAYTVLVRLGGDGRRKVQATCTTSGCVRFLS